MLIKVKYDQKSEGFLLGIPVKQWVFEYEDNEYLGMFILVPVTHNNGSYCEVEALSEEGSEWCVIGHDDEYSRRKLRKSELPDIDQETYNDIYDIWDESAKRHMERAKRLYEKFADEIRIYSQKSREVKEKLNDDIHREKLEVAEKNNWDKNLITKPKLKNDYGQVPE